MEEFKLFTTKFESLIKPKFYPSEQPIPIIKPPSLLTNSPPSTTLQGQSISPLSSSTNLSTSIPAQSTNMDITLSTPQINSSIGSTKTNQLLTPQQPILTTPQVFFFLRNIFLISYFSHKNNVLFYQKLRKLLTPISKKYIPIKFLLKKLLIF